MTDKNLLIREALITDITALTELMIQLGYPSTQPEMEERLTSIQHHSDYKTFVAQVDTQILGMVGMAKGYGYEQNGTYVRVLALVTNDKVRRTGIGKALMQAAENWARGIGAGSLFLNCGNREERSIGHLFYKNLGYKAKSTGYIKKL